MYHAFIFVISAKMFPSANTFLSKDVSKKDLFSCIIHSYAFEHLRVEFSRCDNDISHKSSYGYPKYFVMI